ncbi:MAG: serine--tRNA ligase [Campylobacterota bacterium]
MIDLKLMQKNFDEVAADLAKKGVAQELIEQVRDLFAHKKSALQALEELKAKQNKDSKLFGQYKKEGKDIGPLQEVVAQTKKQIAKQNEQVSQLEEQLQEVADAIPNIPDADVPEGEDEEDNVEIEKVGDIPVFDFTPKEHWELAQNGWIDFERGVKLAGSRFSMLKGQGAKLERALINFFLDHNANHGFEEVSVPYLNNAEMLYGTGQLPKFGHDLFKTDDGLYLIPTAEVPLTNIHNDEIVSAEALPIKYTSFTPCFRKEAGSGGKDTRGIIRQHQFSKVEMVALTRPEESEVMLDSMVECAGSLLDKLGLAYRKVMLCGGDLGFGAAKTIDLEVWLPGQNCYREISSISNTRDFQARRAKIRYKEGKKNKLVHTLNGSSLAIGRTIVALMENYQQSDGSIELPEILHNYI